MTAVEESALGIRSEDEKISYIFSVVESEETMVKRLRDEFNKLDADHSGAITREELQAHFDAQGTSGSAEHELVEHIFESIDADHNGRVSVEEYCSAYVKRYRSLVAKLEETLRKHREVSVELQSARMNLSTAQSTERLNPETGIMANEYGGSLGRLEVTLVDARNLASMDYTGTSDPFVVLSVESADGDSANTVCGEPAIQKSEIKWKDLNPRWDQQFVFKPIFNKVGVLVLRVFDKDKILADEFMGMATVPFSDLVDQLKHDNWLALRADENGPQGASKAKGSIHVKVQFLYSQVEYFLRIVKQHADLVRTLETTRDATRAEIDALRHPFAMIKPAFWADVPDKVDVGCDRCWATLLGACCPKKQMLSGNMTMVLSAIAFFVILIFGVILFITYDFGTGENDMVTAPGEVRRLTASLLT
jgi:hypothetical protein